MKTFFYLLAACIVLVCCNATNTVSRPTANDQILGEQDTVRIANDDIGYEITIIDPGFNSWLITNARPEGYYSQEYLENRNIQYVTEWNIRVLQPQRYNPNLYEMQINYEPGIDYGYEVNYKLYNYFIYFQLTYNQRLGGNIPKF
ncbi:MAG TPA: DUF6146 family protein [Aquaticitalea sp.]|nr:DUF6146 family protein [Aquaticitalea sp.]HNU60353.1 DUF6146 family protein [Aquaticitalea sp.]